jgi:hypothetical protein
MLLEFGKVAHTFNRFSAAISITKRMQRSAQPCFNGWFSTESKSASTIANRPISFSELAHSFHEPLT